MDDITFDYFSGIMKCLIGLVLILSGIIGWPATRYLLGIISSPFTRRKPQKPIGSPFWDKIQEPNRQKPTDAPFWEKYKDPNWRQRDQRGFALSPVLYLLAMIGVLSGVLFSGYLQIFKSGQTVQNSMTVKSDLQAAANTLSAQAVFGVNGATFCPPRSVHQTTGDPCAAAPVTLVQFGDYTGTQLPANYANAGTTGSPVEVGVFAAGSGVKVLDAYGHAYIYCRWENSRSSPALPAFVLLSAGADGNLQTKCGDSAAQGDDGYLMLTVGTAINRATLWQANGNNMVSYGATGTQVTVDSSGDLAAAGNVGIGTTALNKLDVSGGVVIGTTYAGMDAAPISGLLVQGNVSIGAPSTSHQLAVTGNAWAWNFVTDQGAGAYWANSGSTAEAPAYMINGGGGLFSPGGNVLGFSTNNTEQVRITSSGFVGIGTPNPQATLDVDGYARLAAQTSAPATCSSSNKGTFAMTANNGFCFCNGSLWSKMESPATACAW